MNIHNRFKLVFFITFSFCLTSFSFAAEGNGTTGGLNLLRPSGARPAALGEAYSAATNDITAFSYNPASLRTLEQSQASFMYESGFADDAFGSFMLGMPLNNLSLGFNLAYYNGGDEEIYDGLTTRNLTTKTDIIATVGLGMKLGPTNIGLALKGLQSELAETEKATAYAADIGIQMPVGNRLTLGGAIQNVGSQLKFVEEGDDLPRLARVGAALGLTQGTIRTSLMADAAYFLIEKETRPSIGFEAIVGPLALRAGYKNQNDLEDFTFGAGFMLGPISLDYAYGLVDDLDASQRASVTLHFGAKDEKPRMVYQKNPSEPERENLVVIKEEPKTTTQSMIVDANQKSPRRNTVYEIKPGDTLSKIAKKHYGDMSMVNHIFTANAHLIENKENLKVGQRIVLP